MKRTRKATQQGSVLVYVLAVLALILIFTSVSVSVVNFDNSLDNQAYRRTQALHLAESGIDWAIRQLNDNSFYTGENDTALGSGKITIAVSGTGSFRTIDSYGSITTASGQAYTRHVRVDASINTNQVEFQYGLQVDSGGMSMTNNSHIVGDIYSNGTITGGNGSTISGNTVVAGGVTDSPTLSWETNNADQFFAIGPTNEDIAQSFTATTSDRLSKVSFYLAKIGNPTSNLTVRVNADNAGKPATSSLATTTISPNSVGFTAGWVDASFATPPTLTSGTTYWLVLDYGTNSVTNYWNWRKDTTDGYANNTGKATTSCCSGTPTWTSVGGDLNFRVWIGGVSTAINGVTIGSATTGTARANQFINANVHGSNCPNQYCVVDNPAQITMPIPEGIIQDWKKFAATGGTQGSFLASGGTNTLGPKKIDGDFTLDNGASLTMSGTLWVTGNILLQNNCHITLDSGYAGNSGVIVTDGTVTINNGCIFTGAGANSNILLLTTKDAKTSYSMSIGNNSSGVFYYAAKSLINFANNSSAQVAAAWGASLSPGTTITYSSVVASSTFSAGPGGGWQVNGGTWRLF